jgi:hypothetical protein
MRKRKVNFPTDGLTEREVNFVKEYIKTRKATVASEAVGMSPDEGHPLLKSPLVQHAIDVALLHEHSTPKDADWLLDQLVDNHYLCRQMGNLTGSNQALGLLAKHASIDAFTPEVVHLAGHKEVMERLLRARKREELYGDDDPITAEDVEEAVKKPVSFL